MPRVKLEPCPFCKKRVLDKHPWVGRHRSAENKPIWSITHYCEHDGNDLGVCITVYGATKRQAVDRWNTRAADVGYREGPPAR